MDNPPPATQLIPLPFNLFNPFNPMKRLALLLPLLALAAPARAEDPDTKGSP